jgi:hypothetical protein
MREINNVTKSRGGVEYPTKKYKSGGEEANLIGDMRRNCLLRYVIEGKIEGRLEVTGRRLRRSKQLMGDLKEKTGYWK